MPTTDEDPLSMQICPISKLPIERRPDWQDIEFTGDYQVSFAVIGGRILHTRPVGNAGPTGMPRLFDQRRAVLQEAGLWDRPYCEIKDYTGIPLQHPRIVRVQFAELLTEDYERGKLKGFWGYGGPRVFRWIMATAKALSRHPDAPVHFVSDYPTSVRAALLALNVTSPSDKTRPPSRVVRDDWNVAVGGYRVEFEVWDDAILFGRPHGRLSRTAAAHLFDLMERIIADREHFPDGGFAQLSDLSGLHRVDWSGLRYIQQRYLALHEKHPCRGVVTYGGSRAFQGVVRMARAVLPFPYVASPGPDKALVAVRKLTRVAPAPGIIERLRGQSRYSDRGLSRRVTELIKYAATINWHAEGIREPEMDPQDPLAPIYALLRVLKLDFDTMIDDRDRMHAEVLQASKLSSIGLLAAGMAHELNSPLTAVLGYTEHIHRQSKDPQSVDHAGRALKVALRMRDIIDQLSAHSRLGSATPPEPVDINACIEETLGLIDPIMEQHRAVIQRDLAPDLPPIICVPAHFQSVIFNVLGNAFDAYGEPDPQTVDSNPVAITTCRQGDWVEIRCQDWGSGMGHQARMRAFDPFYTTKGIGEGTGLGLYVTHRIVTDFGGTIVLDSKPGQGTTVRIRFPVDGEAA